MKTLLTLTALTATIIWVRRRRERHPLAPWVRKFYDEAVLG